VVAAIPQVLVAVLAILATPGAVVYDGHFRDGRPYLRSRSYTEWGSWSGVVAHSFDPAAADTWGMVEMVCVNNAPGITEGAAVTIARSRLQIRGLAPTEGLRPHVERVALANEAVTFWQVSFLVER